jgi:NAD+ kinase
MERFLIITNMEKDKDLIVTKKIASHIRNAGKQATLSRLPLVQEAIASQSDFEQMDCAIVLGGDGTIIQAANELRKKAIPILGVNLGTVGFLAEIEKNHVEEALDCLFADHYRVENRLMIQGSVMCHAQSADVFEKKKEYALNDIVITRNGFSRIIRLGIYINDEPVYFFRGDGIVISTPTGSTAYNLSAGGPIVFSDADVMVITPVCPHSLSPRSIVVSAGDTIKVTIKRSKKTQESEAVACFDGDREIEMGTDDVIYINKANYNTKLIKLSRTGIYEVLQSKLGNDMDE